MKTKILFLCTGNSCRSQMAEGWARHLKSDVIEAYSAGIEKHGLNPRAVKVMAEAGVDISRQESNLIEELSVKEFDYVITLCGNANETCPFFQHIKCYMRVTSGVFLFAHYLLFLIRLYAFRAVACFLHYYKLIQPT